MQSICSLLNWEIFDGVTELGELEEVAVFLEFGEELLDLGSGEIFEFGGDVGWVLGDLHKLVDAPVELEDCDWFIELEDILFTWPSEYELYWYEELEGAWIKCGLLVIFLRGSDGLSGEEDRGGVATEDCDDIGDIPIVMWGGGV